jgi:hypothetical protein
MSADVHALTEAEALGLEHLAFSVALSAAGLQAAQYFARLKTDGQTLAGYHKLHDQSARQNVQGMIAEVALAEYLAANRIEAAGPLPYLGRKHTPQDFIVWQKGERVTLDVHSSPHYGCRSDYPAGRFGRPDKLVSDYVIAAVVDDKGDRATVHFVGALSRTELCRTAEAIPTRKGHPDYKPIPLEHFDPDLLSWLLAEADKAFPQRRRGGLGSQF